MPRPADAKPPEHLSKSPPVPTPEPVDEAKLADDPMGLNPVRYGDWEHKGIAIDF